MKTDLTAKARAGSAVATMQARHLIGVFGVTGFTLSAAAPLTVVAISASTGFAVIGFVGVPVAYSAVGFILAFFASGYVAMARHIGRAGGFYVYISRGLGRTSGVAAAAVALLGYNLLQISLYGGAGAFAAAGLNLTVLGWNLPWWAYAVTIWMLVAVLGVRSLTANKRVLAGLLIAELAVVLAIVAVLLSHPVTASVDTSALNPGHLLQPQAAAILVGGIAGYIGFETGVVYSDNAKDRNRTIARATFLALGLITAIYVVSTWAMTVAAGSGAIVEAAKAHQSDLFFALAADSMPSWMLNTGRLLLLTSLIAALASFHNMIARVFFSLGREGLLPTPYRRLGRRSAAPVWGSITQSALALIVILTYAIAGLDPIKHLYLALGVTGGLGILILMTATSVAVITYFRRHNTLEPVRRRIIAPAISGVFLTAILAGTIAGFG